MKLTKFFKLPAFQSWLKALTRLGVILGLWCVLHEAMAKDLLADTMPDVKDTFEGTAKVILILAEICAAVMAFIVTRKWSAFAGVIGLCLFIDVGLKLAGL
jgi:type IV conjugative transfer system pilin TraA